MEVYAEINTMHHDTWASFLVIWLLVVTEDNGNKKKTEIMILVIVKWGYYRGSIMLHERLNHLGDLYVVLSAFVLTGIFLFSASFDTSL